MNVSEELVRVRQFLDSHEFDTYLVLPGGELVGLKTKRLKDV